ncbi:Hypothetical protein NGAL_HAMBI2605_09630 [Neorhizobium galegae bv. orientalis]|nr:Hypothetical protein NGAL_HAMBI2605_09630 [Neorhizobium galegae bv. orientalis]
MTAAKQPEETPLTVQGAFATSNYEWFDALYSGLADELGGLMMLAPLTKHSRPNWKADLDDFEVLKGKGFHRSESIIEARRKCVLVRDIVGCDPNTKVIVFFAEHSGENPFVKLVAGQKLDADIASLIVYRQLGAQPRMVPLLPTDPVEPAPSAANDNRDSIPTPSMDAEPFTNCSGDGLIADISRWITSTAIVPVPELSLISTLALLAGVFGKHALGPTNSGINLYITTLMETAGGKGHPPKAARSLGDKCGALGAMSNGDPTSYAAIERMLRKHSSTVITMDEFGITLQDVNGKHQNSVAASIRKMLLAVYDQANSSFDGRIYASSETKKDDGPIVGPALTVLGMTTPSTLYAGLSSASVADGFINRFLFVTAKRDEDGIRVPRLDVDIKPPADLIEKLQAAITAFPKSLVGSKYRVPFEGGETGEAYKRWGQIFMWQHHSAWDDVARNINGRAAENTVRLATIRAISRKPSEPEVGIDDIEWAWAIVHGSIELIADGVAKHMSSSPAEALRKAVMQVMREHEGKTLPWSTLLRKKGIKGADMRELEGAIIWLIQSGEITDVNSRQKPGVGSSFRCNETATS